MSKGPMTFEQCENALTWLNEEIRLDGEHGIVCEILPHTSGYVLFDNMGLDEEGEEGVEEVNVVLIEDISFSGETNGRAIQVGTETSGTWFLFQDGSATPFYSQFWSGGS